MKCIILAAGYATRLYPLTEKYPKPLLKVKDNAIIEWLIDDISSIADIDEIIIISNHKFINIFNEWKESFESKLPVTILDDGSTDNDNRLGAVRDIAFAIKAAQISDDLMVIAGDNLLNFSLSGFYEFFEEKKAACIMRHYEDSVEKLQRTGVALVDENSLVIEMEEKPEKPKSNWAVPPFYLYKKDDLQKIIYGVENEVCNLDAPGSFIEWFCRKSKVYAYLMPGKRYDIGNKESYDRICEEYCGIINKKLFDC